jgi:transposase-like protein
MKGIDEMEEGLLHTVHILREKVLDKMLANLRPDGLVECKFCNSREVVKNGIRKGVQYWLCTNCGCGFVDNRALPRMRYSKDIVAKAVYDYYNGQSLNSIARGIGQQTGNHPSDSSVYTWVQKLTKIAIKESEKYTQRESINAF